MVDQSARGHLETLTALRFVAALLVFGQHIGQALDVPVGPFSVGYCGVSFFFLLSGFVLTWSRRPGETARRFYWHRFARIWPSHAAVTIFVLVAGLAAAPAGALWIDLSLLHTWQPGSAKLVIVNPPSWSLGTEAFFYALFPLLIVWARSRHGSLLRLGAMLVAGTFVATVAAAIISGDALWVYRLPPLRLSEFALGVLLAVALRRGWRPRVRFGPAASLAAGAWLFAWLAGGEDVAFVTNLLIVPAFTVLIAACASRDMLGGRTPRWAVRLGQWSFACYLLHWPVLMAVDRLGMRGIVAVLTSLAVAIGSSALMYVAFERPVERWLRSLVRRPVAAPAPARA